MFSFSHSARKSWNVKKCVFGVSYHSNGSSSPTGMRPAKSRCRRMPMDAKFGIVTTASRALSRIFTRISRGFFTVCSVSDRTARS